MAHQDPTSVRATVASQRHQHQRRQGPEGARTDEWARMTSKGGRPEETNRADGAGQTERSFITEVGGEVVETNYHGKLREPNNVICTTTEAHSELFPSVQRFSTHQIPRDPADCLLYCLINQQIPYCKMYSECNTYSQVPTDCRKMGFASYTDFSVAR